MKTFYDITTIDCKNKLRVSVVLKEHQNPEYLFTVNHILVKNQSVIYLDLLQPINFHCQVQNGAVEILTITINDKQVMPLYLHLSNPPTSWITDIWMLDIPGPFYPWYHQITGQGWTA